MTSEVIEAVLAEFRVWLEDAAAVPSLLDGAPAEEPPPDLHTLLGQFVALRHEVNLQTKAARAQQEQNAETVRQLSQAVEALREKPPDENQDDDLLRPLLKTLVDIADALALARREIERLQGGVCAALETLTAAAGAPPSFWQRWLTPAPGRSDSPPLAGRIQQLLDSVLTGYTMSLQRVERALQQHALEPIAAVGEPFDPERMEVVEAVADSGRPSGEVLAEVRRGYLWHDRVFRYTQVSVAK